jgi:L-malate glycosyltransferase
MKILHTAGTYAPSLDGVAEVARHVSEGLVRKGHEVWVATTARKDRPVNTLIRGVNVRSFEIHGNLARGIKGEVGNYRDFIQSGDWDILINHCAETWPTDAIRDDLSAFRWPSVLVTHGLSVYNDSTFRTYYKHFPETLLRYAAWVAVTNSAEEILFARERGLRRPHVITNGVDTEEWSRAPLGVRQQWGYGHAPWIINVSNHNPNKHHTMLFELAGRLKTNGVQITQIGGSYPMAKWGLGNAGLRGGCYYACRMKAAFSGAVELKTGLRREQVVSAIQEADLVVSTSRWEANSVVLLEAMAAGTPWVSTDVGSARDNAGGIVVNSAGEMAEAIRVLLGDPGQRRSLGEGGRTRVRAMHNWDMIVDQYEDLYRTLISQRNQGLGERESRPAQVQKRLAVHKD